MSGHRFDSAGILRFVATRELLCAAVLSDSDCGCTFGAIVKAFISPYATQPNHDDPTPRRST
jgi:hypothetical protein